MVRQAEKSWLISNSMHDALTATPRQDDELAVSSRRASWNHCRRFPRHFVATPRKPGRNALKRPCRSAANRTGARCLAGPHAAAFPPERPDRVPRWPFRFRRRQVSAAQAFLCSVWASCREASRNRCRHRKAVEFAMPQRRADFSTVSLSARDSPNESQRSFLCSPCSGVPVTALKVRPHDLQR